MERREVMKKEYYVFFEESLVPLDLNGECVDVCMVRAERIEDVTKMAKHSFEPGTKFCIAKLDAFTLCSVNTVVTIHGNLQEE
jgi:hypothetical protein